MGKTWVRGGNNQAQTPKVEHFAKQKRNTNVWTRDATSGANQPETASNGANNTAAASQARGDPENVAPSQGHSRIANNASAADQAAKRRRLAAQGRYIERQESQQQHVSQRPVENQGQDDQGGASQRAQADKVEAEKREKLQRETAALRAQIAEEEAKVLAAKVSFIALQDRIKPLKAVNDGMLVLHSALVILKNVD